jgi:hypothetical protein
MLNSQLSNRAVSIILIFSLTLPAALSIAINLYLDPFEIFSIDKRNPGVFLGGRGRDRYQHAGTLRQYKPKSVIVGNSYAANFLPSHLESILNWNEVFSITLDGSSLYEQNRVLNFGLQVSKIQNVMWLASPSLFSAPFDHIYPKLPFPEYLYNGNHFDDLKLYSTLPNKIYQYSLERTEKIKKIIKESQRVGSPIDPRDRSTEWYSMHHAEFGRANYVAARIFNKPKVNQQDISPLANTKPLHKADIITGTLSPDRLFNVSQNVQHNILPLVRDYPEVSFTLIVHPPFPLLLWQHLKATSSREYFDQLLTIRYLVQVLSPYPNIKIFGFGLSSHVWNLKMYKDGTHYHPRVNADMLSKISENEDTLNKSNILQYLLQFDAAVTQYQPNQKPHET